MPNEKEYLAKKSLLDTKQDVLTPGDNITITNNRISAQVPVVDVLVNNQSVIGQDNIARVVVDTVDANPAQTPTDTLTSIDINGTVYELQGGGSGSDVIPNPVGTPTDTLSTIEIDGTIFDIEGSGSGSGFIDDTIYSSSVDNSVIPLSNSIANYDYIWVMAGYSQDGQDIKISSIFNTSDLENAIGTTERFGISNDAYYTYFSVDSLTQLSKYTWQDRVFIQEVHGLKFGGGSSDAYSETTLWNGSDSETMTLSESFENYGAILFIGKATSNGINYVMTNTWSVEDLKVYINEGSRLCAVANDAWYEYLTIPNNTTFTRQDRYMLYISEIRGIKYGSSSRGGSESKYEQVDLYVNQGITQPNTITLSQDISDFDAIVIENVNTSDANSYRTTDYFLADEMTVGKYYTCLRWATNNEYINFQITALNTLTMVDYRNMYTTRVVGVKYGAGGGGGTSVEANPQEAPTDTLTKIKIEDTVYEIQGGGSSGGSGLQQTVLWDYVQDNSGTIPYDIYSVTLRDNINNYDAITLELVSYSGDLNGSWRGTNISNTFFVDMLNNQLEPGNAVVCTFSQRSVKFYIHDNIVSTTVRNESSTNGLVRVYGLTFGGGKAASEIIPITAGDGTASRTFTFDKIPKKVSMQYIAGGWGLYRDIIWGTDRSYYQASQATVSDSQTYIGVSGVVCDETTKSITITGLNALQASNTADIVGYMYVDYGGGGSGSSSEPDISDMTWTAITSTSYGQSTAVAIPQGTKRLVLTAEYDGIVTKVAEEKIENIQKLLDTSLQNTWNMGAEYADTSGNHTFVAMSVNNNLATAYSGYSGVVVKIYALS